MSSYEDSKRISNLTKEFGRIHTISTAVLKEELNSVGLDTRQEQNKACSSATTVSALLGHHASATTKPYLPYRGSPQVLQKRLKEHYRRVESLRYPHILIWHRKNPYSHYAVIDFEATCDENPVCDLVMKLPHHASAPVGASTLVRKNS
eukprot:sb/3473622/